MTTGDVTYLVEELARLTDAVKRLGALAQQPVQPQSSVEIARNSKGVTWVVKAYHPDPVEASTWPRASMTTWPSGTASPRMTRHDPDNND